MIDFKKNEVWFLTGSQHLYGPETLQKVEKDSQEIAKGLSEADEIPVQIVYKPVLTTSESIYNIMLEANSSEKCIGLITWMHTFSPAKMWIAGLKVLQKPFAHLHTQFSQDIPWSKIDMDFMNLNQSAHGGREFGYICSRMKINRKVITGHWQDKRVQHKLSVWIRAAAAWHDAKGAKLARFGDNMREVAVTEGDKVEAQIRFGYSVNGYGLGDLVKFVDGIPDASVDKLIDEYKDKYIITDEVLNHKGLKDSARIELGIRAFLQDGGFKAFTTTFENLTGLKQLPGIAVQRLMADGYGFGAEGDWKTAALLRSMKVMSAGLPGGTSFMEDYTYHLDPAGNKVLGSHMLEICESIASDKPKLEIHPLSIGGKEDPARLVFNVAAGEAINVSVIDMGNRFRMILNEVEVIDPDEDLPKLPVARALWVPKPDLETAAESWIYAGGAHHTGFSKAITAGYIQDFAEIAGIELIEINDSSTVSSIKKEIKWNDLSY